MATHSSILAWEIPWTGAWRAIVHRVAESDMTTTTICAPRFLMFPSLSRWIL